MPKRLVVIRYKLLGTPTWRLDHVAFNLASILRSFFVFCPLFLRSHAASALSPSWRYLSVVLALTRIVL